MFVFEFKEDLTKEEFYKQVNDCLKHLIDGQRNWITNFANASSLLNQGMKSATKVFQDDPIMWVGFYMVDPNQDPNQPNWLYLGPFQGKVACTRIKFGRGKNFGNSRLDIYKSMYFTIEDFKSSRVCGTAAESRVTQLVSDVHKFPGHIACDAAANSEIVVPIIQSSTDELKGVLDIDSKVFNTFDLRDKFGLEEFVKILADGSDFN